MPRPPKDVTNKTDEQQKEPATNHGRGSQTSHHSTEAQQFADPSASENTLPLKRKRNPVMSKSNVQFIKIGGNVINSRNIAAAIAVNSPEKKGVILRDESSKVSVWEECENFEQAKEVFNQVTEKMPKKHDVLFIENHAVIPFDFINSVSKREINGDSFVIIQGKDSRALIMFGDNEWDDLDSLHEELTGILCGELSNEMIKVTE